MTTATLTKSARLFNEGHVQELQGPCRVFLVQSGDRCHKVILGAGWSHCSCESLIETCSHVGASLLAARDSA